MPPKKPKKSDLGFKYPRSAEEFVDADEYREFLGSGKLKPDEADFLKQFLAEYYGKPSKKQLKLHEPHHYQGLCEAARARDRDVLSNAPDFSPVKPQGNRKNTYYTPDDYSLITHKTPEDALLALGETDDPVINEEKE